jgi:type IV pilus assembly protein PilW
MARRAGRSRSRGFTLVELMVGMVLGMVVVLAALSMYINSASSTRASRENGRLNMDAQAALQLLAGQMRMAGFSRPRVSVAEPGYQTRNYEGVPLLGCEGGFTDPQAATLACAGATPFDAFAVYYEADDANAATAASGILDCAGAPVEPLDVPAPLAGTGDSEKFNLVENRYYVVPDAQLRQGTLVCVGRSADGKASPVTLAAGVIEFKLTYLAARADGTVVSAPAAKLVETAATPEAAWQSARSVDICLVLVSEATAADQPVPYVNCAGQTVMPTDARQRRRHVATVSLRNRAPATT